MVADQVKALVFDVFGTVVDWRGSITREADQLLRDRGIDGDPEQFALSWRAKYQPAMERVRSGGRGFVKLDVLHRENLLEVLSEFGVTGLSEAEIDDVNRMWHRLAPWPDSVPGLTRLRTRYVLGTMSNGNVALMVNMAKNAGLPWDVILGAEVAQAYKPAPKTYLTGCDLLDLAPAQVMLVAAHNGDLLAARECGLRTAFVARPTEYGGAQDRDFKAEHEFDYIADSMIDLADQMGC